VPSSNSNWSKPSAAVAPSLLRAMNQRYLLDWLFTHGSATRPQLSKDAGLSQPTVFATLADLEQAGLVRSLGSTGEQAGRPALVYEADPTAGAVAAVDVGRDWVRVVVADLASKELAKTVVHNTARNVDSLVRVVHDAVEWVSEEAGLDLSGITHTIIASPTTQFGRRAYSSQFRGWQWPKLADALREGLGTSLTVENDVNLAALGEYMEGTGEQQFNPYVYLHIGTGLGLGLVIDGQLYRGATRAEGEVGLIPLLSGDSELSGRPRYQMFEETLAAEAVVRYARAAGMEGPLTALTVFEAARNGSTQALAAVQKESDAIAYLLAGVCAILDPELIVLGGGVGQNLDLLGAGILERLTAITPFTVRLEAGRLGANATVRGALSRGVVLAREMVFNARI
jgi:predicted NBD/HSP70 family sugar kinase